FCSNKTSF
ncbi:cobyric acid synthase CobQ, partial [Vibrio harveyi]